MMYLEVEFGETSLQYLLDKLMLVLMQKLRWTKKSTKLGYSLTLPGGMKGRWAISEGTKSEIGLS